MNCDKEIAVYDNTVSARTYVSYIAESAGGFAHIGRDGKLYIKTIGETTATLPIRYFQKFKWGEKIKITRVSYEDGIQSFKNGDTTGNTIHISQDNMFIVDQEQIDNIYNQINGLEVYSFEGDSIIDPAWDIGDLLIIDNKKVIFQGSADFGGKWKASINSKIQCKAKEETMVKTPSQAKINRRFESKINQAEGNIKQLAEETQQIKLEQNNNYQEINKKLDGYVKEDDLVTVKKSVENIQNSTEYYIKVTEDLQVNGVSKVKTEKGFTFDDNGLTIDELNSKVKNKLDENGMEILDKTSGTQEVLLKAGYDATAGETIVKSKNMVVEKYLTIGANTRFEDYVNPTLGGKGTGAFTL